MQLQRFMCRQFARGSTYFNLIDRSTDVRPVRILLPFTLLSCLSKVTATSLLHGCHCSPCPIGYTGRFREERYRQRMSEMDGAWERRFPGGHRQQGVSLEYPPESIKSHESLKVSVRTKWLEVQVHPAVHVRLGCPPPV